LIGRQVIIQDEIRPDVSGAILWVVHTSAEPVSVVGPVARFRSGNSHFVARILEPADAFFEIAFPPEPKVYSIADIRRLHGRPGLDGNGVRVTELPRRIDDESGRAAGALIRRLQIPLPAGTQRLSVALMPDCEGDELALPVSPLDDWLAKRPVRLAQVSRRGVRIEPARHAATGAPRGLSAVQTRRVRRAAARRTAYRRSGSSAGRVAVK
jgi:hypothetical protein